jgi:hypothetical protein
MPDIPASPVPPQRSRSLLAPHIPQVVTLKAPRYPISAKTHGAWLGAGTGSAVAAIVVGLIETYVTHRTVPAADVSLIYTACTALVAFLGSYIAPHQARPGDSKAPLPPA